MKIPFWCLAGGWAVLLAGVVAAEGRAEPPTPNAFVRDEITVYLDQDVLHGPPGTAELQRGDMVTVDMGADGVPTGERLRLVAYLETRPDGDSEWKRVKATSYARRASYHTAGGNACVWAFLPSADAGRLNCRAALFLPYRACHFAEGKSHARYVIHVRTSERIVLEHSSEANAFYVRAAGAELPTVFFDFAEPPAEPADPSADN